MKLLMLMQWKEFYQRSHQQFVFFSCVCMRPEKDHRTVIRITLEFMRVCLMFTTWSSFFNSFYRNEIKFVLFPWSLYCHESLEPNFQGSAASANKQHDKRNSWILVDALGETAYAWTKISCKFFFGGILLILFWWLFWDTSIHSLWSYNCLIMWKVSCK